jgi:hypothetical protein
MPGLSDVREVGAGNGQLELILEQAIGNTAGDHQGGIHGQDCTSQAVFASHDFFEPLLVGDKVKRKTEI